MKKVGEIIEPPTGNIREHERRTATALANSGLNVEFILKSEQDYTKSPDVLINNKLWEMKSPRTAKLSQVEKNLKRASRQSGYIIIDSQRIKHLPDKKLQAFLYNRLRVQKTIRHLLFVNRRREVIDINDLV